MTRANPLRCGMTAAELRAARAALAWCVDLFELPAATGPRRFMRATAGRSWCANLRHARAALERELATIVFVDQARASRRR